MLLGDVRINISSNSLLTYSMDGLEAGSRRPSFISDDSWKFFQEVACESAGHVVIAQPFGSRRVIGWFRFTLQYKPTRHLYAQGTWIDVEYRKLGIAKALWDCALKEKYPSTVSVVIASHDGRALIRTMKRRHIKVLFFDR